MLRLFLILMVAGLMVWIGQRYFMNHPDGQGFWDSVGSTSVSNSPTPASGANTSPTPTPTPTLTERLNGHRKTLMALTQKVLLPLESKDFSGPDVVKTLQQTERELLQYRPDPNYKNLTQSFNHLMQACNVLSQALVDRQAYMQRLVQDASPPKGTPSPLQMSTLQPSATVKDTSGFFVQRVLTEWNERCAYYEPIIDGLLTATN